MCGAPVEGSFILDIAMVGGDDQEAARPAPPPPRASAPRQRSTASTAAMAAVVSRLCSNHVRIGVIADDEIVFPDPIASTNRSVTS